MAARKKPRAPETRTLRSGSIPDKSKGRPRVRARHTEPVWIPVFLRELKKHGIVSEACRAAGKPKSTVYDYAQNHESFRVEMDDAKEAAADNLEKVAMRLSTEGVLEPVFGSIGGGVSGKIGEKRVWPISLIQFMLRGARPEKYTERGQTQMQVTTINTGPVKGYAVAEASPDAWPDAAETERDNEPTE